MGFASAPSTSYVAKAPFFVCDGAYCGVKTLWLIKDKGFSPLSGTIGPNDHWMYQGRQQHGWFGHGTESDDIPNYDVKTLFDPGNAGQRVNYVASAMIGHLPKRVWKSSGATFDTEARRRLRTVVAAWNGAAGLTREEFRDSLLPPGSSSQTVDHLRQATRKIMAARSFEDLGPASKDLAAAVENIGVSAWPRYLAEAESRAKTAVAGGTLSKIMLTGAENNSDGAKFIKIRGKTPELANVNDVLHPATPKRGPNAEANQPQKVDFFTTSESEARQKYGMSNAEFREAIHKLKKAAGLGAADDLEFHIPSGDVFFNGEYKGNMFDE